MSGAGQVEPESKVWETQSLDSRLENPARAVLKRSEVLDVQSIRPVGALEDGNIPSHLDGSQNAKVPK